MDVDILHADIPLTEGYIRAYIDDTFTIDTVKGLLSLSRIFSIALLSPLFPSSLLASLSLLSYPLLPSLPLTP